TFSAMTHGSGPLAIGELIGAANFIASVVAGSMAVIKPFRVKKAPFLRDVLFFSTAIAFTLAIIWDGYIYLWECIVLVLLYVIYVTVVVLGNWMQKKRRLLEQKNREEFAQSITGNEVIKAPEEFGKNAYGYDSYDETDLLLPEGERGLEYSNQTIQPMSMTPLLPYDDFESYSQNLFLPTNDIDQSRHHQHGGSTRPMTINPWTSVEGTSDLARNNSSTHLAPSTLSVPSTPKFLAIPRIRIPQRRSSSLSPPPQIFSSPLNISPLNISPSHEAFQIPSPSAETDQHLSPDISIHSSPMHSPIVTTASSPLLMPLQTSPPITIWKKLQFTLFPSLTGFFEKSFVAKLTALMALPTILVLKLTLPVVEVDDIPLQEEQKNSQLRHLDTPSIVVNDDHDLAIIDEPENNDDEPPKFYPALSFMGFGVAIVWIYLLANEVVGLLQVSCTVRETNNLLKVLRRSV
ncbi:2667_t:CDS:2, partial [Racocetra fulgida]